MKIILVYIFIWFLGYFAPVSNKKLECNCLFVQDLLDQDDINSILGLDKEVEVNPYIRIFDLTNTFTDCTGFYKQKNSKTPVPYFVENKLKATINTGYFRDLVIDDFIDNEGTGKIIVSVSEYKARGEIKVTFRLVINYTTQHQNKIVITESKITDYVDSPPYYDYENK